MDYLKTAEEIRKRTDLAAWARKKGVDLGRRGGKYVGHCPFHEEDTANFTVYPETNTFYCFGCAAAGNVISFTEQLEHKSFLEAVRELSEETGIKAESEFNDNQEPILEEQDRYQKQVIAAFPGSAGQAFLRENGIAEEIEQENVIGYDALKKQVIVYYPDTAYYYASVSVENDVKYSYPSAKETVCLSDPLFNSVSFSFDNVIFTDDLLDALVLKHLNYNPVFCSPAAMEDLNEEELPGHVFYLGKKGTALYGKLEEMFMFRSDDDRFGAAYLPENCDSIHEMYVNGEKEVRDLVEGMFNSTFGEIDRLMKSAEEGRFDPIPTGFRPLDGLLGGGIRRQQLIVLEGNPGIGKTALMQQTVDSLARDGMPVVFYSLNRSKEQLLARSIAREASEYIENMPGISDSRKNFLSVSWKDVLKSSTRKNELKKKTILEAAERYKETTARNIRYNPGRIIDFTSLQLELERMGGKAEEENRQAPIAVIDGLQLIPGDGRETEAELTKKILNGLKDYAVRYDTAVFLISEGHSEPDGDAGKLIRYSADTLLRLEYPESERLDDDGSEPAYVQDIINVRFVTLKVLKPRSAWKGKGTELKFNSEACRFAYRD